MVSYNVEMHAQAIFLVCIFLSFIVAIFSHKKHHLSAGMNQFKYLSKYILQLDGANLYLIYEDFKHTHGFCQCIRLDF